MKAILEEVRIGIHAVWRRRWLALAVAWAIALVGWLGVSLIPNTYESSAQIYIEPQSILPQAVGISSSDQQQGINTVRQTLLSADNLTGVIKATDLNRQAATPRDMAIMVDRLQKAVSVRSTQDNLFQISADLSGGGFSDAQNARLTQAVVGKLIDLFLASNAAGGVAEAQRSLQFLDAQLAQRGAQLADVETNLAAAQSSLAAINGQLAATPATIPGPPSTSGAGGPRERLGQLQAQLAQYQAQGWTDQHPDVIALRKQIARLQGAAAAEPAGGSNSQPNPAYISLRSMVAEKQANAAALAARRAQVQSDLNAFGAKQASEPDITAEQARLSRDHDVLKAQYDKLLSDREQVKLRAAAQSQSGSVQIRVIDPPSLSHVPAKPKRPLLLTIVLLAALAGGAAAAFVRAKLQTSYSTPAALAAASGLPVLGGISFIADERHKTHEAQQLKWFVGAGGALVGAYILLLGVEFVQRGLMA